MRRTRGAIATGLLLAAAFLTKQNGLAEGVAVLTALTFGPRRRLVWPAALTYGAVLGISTLMLGLTSRGWYVYYVFVLMTEHTLKYAAFAQFWTVYLLPMLGLAGCALILGLRRTPLVLVAGCGAVMVESYAALVHSGGRVNDLLPAYLAVALLAGLALGAQPGGLVSFYADRIARVRVASWQAGRIGPWVAAAAAALVITQMAVLVSGFRPGQTIPTSADRAVGLRLTAGGARSAARSAPARPGPDGRRQLPGESAGGIRRSVCMALAGGDGRAIPAVRRRVRSAATPHIAGRRAAETPGARSAPGPAP